MQFVVLSSSRGTTFQAILDRIKDGSLTATCAGLVTDRADRGCIDKAEAANVPFAIVEKVKEESQEKYDQRVSAAIENLFSRSEQETHSLKLIACCGWMFIFTPWFISQWKNRILNVHPALLPNYGGQNMYGDRVHQAILDAKEPESGMTIHSVDEGVDTGKILVQKKCSISPGETAASLKDKVQALEKEWYPKTLEMIERGEVKLPE